MYYYIKGRLALKGDNYVVVDAGGVGYMIYTSLNSLRSLPEREADITMYTYLNVREDAQELYGFSTTEEKSVFMQLLSVSGVGVKAALAVLSVLTPPALVKAVVTENEKAITKAQGIGPKAAKRIILELKDKLKKTDIAAETAFEAQDAPEAMPNAEEAVSALIVLGYGEADARAAVSAVDAELPTEEIIRRSLSRLM